MQWPLMKLLAQYNRFRYYDPSIGKYVSADPIGQLIDINIYRYSFNDPIGQLDPLGLGGPGTGFRGAGLSFGQPQGSRNTSMTDAEGRQRAGELGAAAAVTVAGIAAGSAATGVGLSPPVTAGLAAAGLAAAMLEGASHRDGDGDNDNDGRPDLVDTDDDNDGIPDLIDPDPLISCDFKGGICETPVKNSCDEGDAP